MFVYVVSAMMGGQTVHIFMVYFVRIHIPQKKKIKKKIKLISTLFTERKLN